MGDREKQSIGSSDVGKLKDAIGNDAPKERTRVTRPDTAVEVEETKEDAPAPEKKEAEDELFAGPFTADSTVVVDSNKRQVCAVVHPAQTLERRAATARWVAERLSRD